MIFQLGSYSFFNVRWLFSSGKSEHFIYLSAFLTIVVKLLNHYRKEAAYGKILPIAKTVD